MMLKRIAAWLVFAAIVVVTLGPINVRPHTDFPVNLERAAAYLVMGLAFAVAYPRHIWLAVAFVLIGAVGLEWLQEMRPDRHSRLADAMAKLAGACIGLGIGWFTAQILKNRQRQ